MNSQLAEETRKHFGLAMREHFPGFEEVRTPGVTGKVYRAALDGRYVFIRLKFAQQIDGFTLEIAVSPNSDFPSRIMGAGPFTIVNDGFIRTRIDRLLPDPPKMGIWWWLNESHEPDLEKIIRARSQTKLQDACKRIPGLVADAIGVLQRVLPAYLVELRSIYRQQQ